MNAIGCWKAILLAIRIEHGDAQHKSYAGFENTGSNQTRTAESQFKKGRQADGRPCVDVMVALVVEQMIVIEQGSLAVIRVLGNAFGAHKSHIAERNAHFCLTSKPWQRRREPDMEWI